MTTPPPYAGRTTGQAETPNSEYGATTVSGKPANGHIPDPEPKSATAPAAPVTDTVSPAAARREPLAPHAAPSPASASPTAHRPNTLPGLGSPVPGHGMPIGGPATPLVTGSAAPPPGGHGPAPASAPVPKPSRAEAARGPRRARLQLRHIDPWTVLKFSCVLSIALFFVWLIVIGVLFGILDAAGVVGKINDSVILINGSGSKAPVTAGIVFGGAAIIGVVNIVLFIALSTIGSVVYNLCADLVGGIELTLSER